MRIAVLSDIHGNCVALDAVLADLERHPVDQMVCLGDAIQGGPQPAETVQRLREIGCPTVMGNSDAWLLTGMETGHENISPARRERLNRGREWSLSRLSEADRAFIAAWPLTISIPLNNDMNLLCFHGSPASFDTFILPSTPEEEFQRELMPYAAENILTGGHMHLPYRRRIKDSFFFNPGSVGVAYNHQQEESTFRLDHWAEYAVLTVDGPRIALEHRRLPFDVERFIRVYQESQQPYWEVAVARYGPKV